MVKETETETENGDHGGIEMMTTNPVIATTYEERRTATALEIEIETEAVTMTMTVKTIDPNLRMTFLNHHHNQPRTSLQKRRKRKPPSLRSRTSQ